MHRAAVVASASASKVGAARPTVLANAALARALASSSSSSSATAASASASAGSGSSAAHPHPAARVGENPITLQGARAVPITVAAGDGIGPEIMGATLEVLSKAQAPLNTEFIEVGERLYERGVMSGIDSSGWASIDRTKVMLKAPITTPLGKGVKSLNVTMRKTLGLFANVRPVYSYDPYVKSLHPKLDVVVIRENEEDLYAGIEHRHTAEVFQCIKLITIPGTERIVRYAFDYCRTHGRKKLTCVTKSNIMKLTDGTFQQVFLDIAKEYPDIQANHEILDIATARMAARPEKYDVVVTLNLYGDVISDVLAEVAGSVGLCGSANIGTNAAMFEAVHGSAPDIAGKDIANPSGLINASVMMLNYLSLHDKATVIHNALLKTLEDGIHTADVAGPLTKKKVGTKEFSQEVVLRLGDKPTKLKPVNYVGETKDRKQVEAPKFVVPQTPVKPIPRKDFVGVDIFVDWDPINAAVPRDPEHLAQHLQRAAPPGLALTMISNRGVKVWPNGHPSTFRVDHWRCRYERVGSPGAWTGTTTPTDVASKTILKLLDKLNEEGLEVIKTENLYTFDGVRGFSLGQGQ